MQIQSLSAAAATTTPIDLTSWAIFTSSCFSFKSSPPPPSLFITKTENDPDYSPHDIILLLSSSSSPSILASYRIFHRRLHSCPEPVIGIGEVCVHPDYRGRGLAQHLLRSSLPASSPLLLHASLASARPTYTSLGFTSCPPISYQHLPRPDAVAETSVRVFDASHDAALIATLYAVHLRLPGTCVRSPEYVARWVAPFFASKGLCLICPPHAYMFLHRRNDLLVVDEFAGPPALFASLLSAAPLEPPLAIASVLYQHIFPSAPRLTRQVLVDDGFMVRNLLAPTLFFAADAF